MMKEEKSITKSSEQTKSRGSRDRHQKKDKPKPLTKVIIRRLPPTMTEEEFLKQIDPLPDHEFYYYAAADWSLGFDATCRAYITFRNHEDVFLFRDRFDGYVFVDTKGEEYPAVVEFSPFQGLPKNKARKTDPKVNSIESEQHYSSFLQKLEEDREACKSECKLEFSLPIKDDKKMATTPLLQFIKDKKMERREEQKKRTEDNRRKRDEDKQKRRNRVSKGIPSAIKEESAASAKDAKPKAEGTADNPEEKKNSRAKRRAERDQRRREEHEQRRREKEKERTAENEQKALQTSNQQSAKDPEKPVTIAKPPDGDSKRKEVKKYSERRERNRPRNSQNSGTATAAADTESKKAAATSAATPVDNAKPPAKEDNAMINFMKNLSNVKEFVPKHKQEAADRADSTEVDMEEVKEKLEKISLKERDQKTPSPEKEDDAGDLGNRSQRNSSSSGGYPNETKSEDRIDRRIRNKDRPSIAIYQPGRNRLRVSDEGQPSADPSRSNPTSDTESLKKEERSNTARKVTRYSERRSGRGRDGKRRNSGEERAGGKGSENTETEADADGVKEEQKDEKAIEGPKQDVEKPEEHTE